MLKDVAEATGAVSEGEAPSTDTGTPLGINPFEEVFNAANEPAESQSADSTENPEAVAELDGTAKGASLESDAESTDSFLSDEERGQFDTTSPEYKAMQASFTRKMQGLADRERELQAKEDGMSSRLEAVEARLNAPQEQQAQQAAPQSLWEGFSGPGLHEDLGDYRDSITNYVQAVAEHVLQRSNEAAMVEQQRLQQQAIQSSLQQQAAEFRADPAHADYAQHYDTMKSIAQANPTWLQQPDGLKRIYRAAKAFSGEQAPAPQTTAQPTAEDYARGVRDGMNNITAKRQAAVPPTPQSAPDTRPAAPSYDSLEQAIMAEGARAAAQFRR